MGAHRAGRTTAPGGPRGPAERARGPEVREAEAEGAPGAEGPRRSGAGECRGTGGSAGSLLRPARRHRELPLPLPLLGALRSHFAPAVPIPPFRPSWASPRRCSRPFPVLWPRMAPGEARSLLSGPLCPGPSGASWWAWARPGLGASSRPRGRLGLPGPFPQPLVFRCGLSRLFLCPILRDPCSLPAPLGLAP